jgi:hypothetical protein
VTFDSLQELWLDFQGWALLVALLIVLFGLPLTALLRRKPKWAQIFGLYSLTILSTFAAFLKAAMSGGRHGHTIPWLPWFWVAIASGYFISVVLASKNRWLSAVILAASYLPVFAALLYWG